MVTIPKSLEDRTWNVCVVGTGPCGMALALELERLGQEVLLLEAGDETVDAALADASRALLDTPGTHAAMDVAVCRALGGTSWYWGGRCVAYDDVDWLDRDYVPEARWPIGHEVIQPWYKRATEHLLCGSDVFSLPTMRALTGGLTLDRVERWSRESRVILVHRDHLMQSKKIQISLKTVATDLTLDGDGTRVSSLTARTESGAVRVRARCFVLAMGGVETTRFLLCAQRKLPHLFGGEGGPLGRYYMGHLSGKIADIAFNDPRAVDAFDFKLDGGPAYFRRRLQLTAETQLQHKLLNASFWPDNAPFHDPRHESGVLSSVFLALAFPPTGRRLLPEAIRLAHTGSKPYPIAAHLRNAVFGAPRGAVDIYRILRDRFIRKPRKPGFLVLNPGGRYALHYHAEQVPNAESRIRLSEESDSNGLQRARIDFRYTDQDVQSVIESHRILDLALRQNRIGSLQYSDTRKDLLGEVYAQASDGYHQMGTTRMGNDPRSSVVDADLRAHTLANLYVASSSVFRSASQANSTLLAVAMAARLAHHLALKSGDAVPALATHLATPAPEGPA